MFGLMGDANMQYIVDYMQNGGQYVGAVHETGAVAMADGYGRVTGTVGVATVTHGPGLTNTLTALTEAVRNRSQLLMLTGETKAGFDLSPQVIDIAAVIAPTGAGYERVHRADTFAADFRRALRRVTIEGRPVVLNIPFDLLNADAGNPEIPGVGSFVEAVPAVGHQSIDDALGVLVSAKRPVILAGRGAVRACAREDLIRLADLVGAPVATTLLGKDYFRGHPRNIGICGTVSSPIGAQVVAEADCVVAFGASLNKHTAGPTLAGKRIVQCDVDPQRIGAFMNVDLAVLGDAKSVAAAMADSLVDARFEVVAGDADLVARLEAASPRDQFEDHSDGTDPRPPDGDGRAGRAAACRPHRGDRRRAVSSRSLEIPARERPHAFRAHDELRLHRARTGQRHRRHGGPPGGAHGGCRGRRRVHDAPRRISARRRATSCRCWSSCSTTVRTAPSTPRSSFTGWIPTTR